ncbi:unnamed protein product [Lymnaea stagnalis]|uniref:Uncharacterized protein n=1 Tax=Lymnaea stagnalis TaxID=6523 RepID=A0AAV2HFK4_LYMST
MIMALGSGAIFLTLILCLICHKKIQEGKNLLDNCLKCTQDKSLNGGYDEINDGYIVANHGVYEGEQNTRQGIITIDATIENQDYAYADEICVSVQNVESENMLNESNVEENINIASNNDTMSLNAHTLALADHSKVNINYNVQSTNASVTMTMSRFGVSEVALHDVTNNSEVSI